MNVFIIISLFFLQSFFSFNILPSFGFTPLRILNVQRYKDAHPRKLSMSTYFENTQLSLDNYQGQLTWYPIGFSKHFGTKPSRIVIRNKNYIVWKDKKGNYYGLDDCCSHQGSSFMLGNTCHHTITCPYHGYVFDGNDGELLEIPQLPHMKSHSHNIDCFKVVERGNIVYLNSVPINEITKHHLDESKVFIEPEFFDQNQRAVYLNETFEHHGKFVSINSLDICHIGFVHTFGNKKRPNPLKYSKIQKMDDHDHHYKISYEYIAGENSLVSKVYNFSKIIVENEYVLPHSTVARVKFGNFTSTIITHAQPVSDFKTILYVKAYRSYWSYNLKEPNPLNFLYYFINQLGDYITFKTMFNTLKEDKGIVDNIDKGSYERMNGKFSILYDLFSGHYKKNYNKYYGDNITTNHDKRKNKEEEEEN